jgi:hypothetical protein
MTALDAALAQLDRVADEGDLTAERATEALPELDGLADPVELPDGRSIYPPRAHCSTSTIPRARRSCA